MRIRVRGNSKILLLASFSIFDRVHNMVAGDAGEILINRHQTVELLQSTQHKGCTEDEVGADRVSKNRRWDLPLDGDEESRCGFGSGGILPRVCETGQCE